MIEKIILNLSDYNSVCRALKSNSYDLSLGINGHLFWQGRLVKSINQLPDDVASEVKKTLNRSFE